MSDHIAIACPNCLQTLNVRSEYLGRRATCKHCKAVITLKNSQEAKAPSGKVEGSAHGTGTTLWEPKPSADLEQELRAEIDRLKRYITSISKERDALRADFEETRANLTDARATVERLQGVETELSIARGNLEESTAGAERMVAELEAANRRHEGLQDELQTEHATRHHEALSQAETNRVEAETWKSGHDEMAREHGAATRLFDEERSRIQADLDRLAFENETLNTQLSETQTRFRNEAESLQSRLSELENERESLSADLADSKRGFDELSMTNHAIDSEIEKLRSFSESLENERGVLRESLTAAEEKGHWLESETLRGLQESTESLETRVKLLTGELDEKRARNAELETEIERRVQDGQRDHRLLLQAQEFKAQIRTFLSGLGINLPES